MGALCRAERRSGRGAGGRSPTSGHRGATSPAWKPGEPSPLARLLYLPRDRAPPPEGSSLRGQQLPPPPPTREARGEGSPAWWGWSTEDGEDGCCGASTAGAEAGLGCSAMAGRSGRAKPRGQARGGGQLGGFGLPAGQASHWPARSSCPLPRPRVPPREFFRPAGMPLHHPQAAPRTSGTRTTVSFNNLNVSTGARTCLLLQSPDIRGTWFSPNSKARIPSLQRSPAAAEGSLEALAGSGIVGWAHAWARQGAADSADGRRQGDGSIACCRNAETLRRPEEPQRRES